MVERLLPGAHVLTRPRHHSSRSPEKKITRLPRRSAVVAFSAEEVYSIMELIRRQRGGAAVVLGALSPRTRNAQVALYQAGDVEYLVATDAIGMGLNLDVDHVAFASDRKFDGYQFKLNPAELAQIAGRAGRATRNGTFGTTGRCPPFEVDLAQALESHSFEPIKTMRWRNTTLDFSSIRSCRRSSPRPPGRWASPVRPSPRIFWCSITLRGTRRSGAGDHADDGGATLGGLPGPGLSQDLARDPCRACHNALQVPDSGRHHSHCWFARQVDE